MQKNQQTEWNLGLLYKSADDKQINEDVLLIESAVQSFAKKYHNRDFTKDSKILLKALVDYEKVIGILGEHKAWWYFILKSDLDSSDSESSAKSAQFSSQYRECSNKLLFFELKLACIPSKTQKDLLKEAPLKKYHYFLKKIFEQAKYNLSEAEEKIINVLDQPACEMWIDAGESQYSKLEVRYKKQLIPIARAQGIVSDLKKRDRDQLHIAINSSLRSVADTAESEINALYTYKKIMDNMRGYEKPYSATVLSYQNDIKTVETLVDVVTKNYDICHSFYDLHARLLGQKRLSLSDRNTKIGVIKRKFDFTSAAKIVRDSFGAVNPEFAQIFDKYLENGQIDVYPNKGKKGGAYCSSVGQLPSFVLLNHTDDIRSVETLAHEMGHALHSEYSRELGPLVRDYSYSCAEVASTFFEQVVAGELEKQLSPLDQKTLLHARLVSDISTIFRQIAFFNYELELHTELRKHGRLSKEQMAEIMNKHLAAYLGDTFDLSEDDGYFFVGLSHIRRSFYVYTYAFGQLVSRAMYKKYKEDSAFIEKVKIFLSAGGSESPKEIFKNMGIDITSAEFYQEGIAALQQDIVRLSKM